MTRINGRAPGATAKHRDTHTVTYNGAAARLGWAPWWCVQCRRAYSKLPTV